MALHIDEAGTDGLAAGIDLLCGCSAREVADSRDGIAPDADIAVDGSMTATVINVPIPDDGVVVLGFPTGEKECEDQRKSGV